MCGACHINGTLGRKEVLRFKLSYMRMASHKGEDYLFWVGVDPSRYHVLKKETYHFLDISLHSTKDYSRHKLK